MADTFGALALPLPAPATGFPVADPCLRTLADYFSAFLTAYATTAWQSVAPTQPVVKASRTHDPQKGAFVDRELPALFVFRSGQAQPPSWWTADWLVGEDVIRILWVLPPTKQETQRARDSIVNGVVKLLLEAVARELDPCWVAAGDTDPQASTLAAAPTAIKLSVATAAAPVSYSGAALNGAIGVGATSPPRPVCLVAAGAADQFTSGSTATITGTNALGLAQSSTLTITGPGTFTTTDEYATVASVAIGAQVGTGGTFTVGVGAFQGRGSAVRTFAGLMEWWVSKWQFTTLPIQVRTGVGDATSPRIYEALSLDLTVREILTTDLAASTLIKPQTSIDVSYQLSDGSVFETQKLPDAGG